MPDLKPYAPRNGIWTAPSACKLPDSAVARHRTASEA